mmetsp:Transcript_19949/g.29703  ORF Transcript_19949/g.29703 Transcript_19949/m.29703 type:complete len:313 (-) Transcript_19949:153-1091(-)
MKVLCLILGVSNVSAFVGSRAFQEQRKSSSSASMIVPEFGSDFVLSEITDDKMGELVKSAAIVAAFGGGLVPAAFSANKSMMGTMSGTRAGGDDPNADKIFTASSGPALPQSGLLFAKDKINLVDVVAIVGRIKDTASIADWANLPSTKRENLSDPSNPPMWLPRGEFKKNIRKAKFTGWPSDPSTGEPVGGAELEKALGKQVGAANYPIPDSALDAVFDTWAWGSGIATPDKVETQLKNWRVGKGFDVAKFSKAAVSGRSVTGLAIVTFIVIQVTVYGALFIAPLLRVFFDIDIGFGQLGSCGENGCTTLF